MSLGRWCALGAALVPLLALASPLAPVFEIRELPDLGPALLYGGQPVKAVSAGVMEAGSRAAGLALLERCRAKGWNAVVIWPWSPWEVGWPQPWLQLPDGRYQVSKRLGGAIVPTWNPAWWDDLRFFVGQARGLGLGVILVGVDGTILRYNKPWHAFAPGMIAIDAWQDSGLPAATVPANAYASRRADRYFYLHNFEGSPPHNYGSTGYYNPALKHYIRELAAVARDFGSGGVILQLWNEMHSDERHAEFDIPYMVHYTAELAGHVRDVFPGCLVSQSVGTEQELAVAAGGRIDLITIHGLCHRCNCQVEAGAPGGFHGPSPGMTAAVAEVRAAAPRVAIDVSDDGCQCTPSCSDPWRSHPEWVAAMAALAHRHGCSFTHKGRPEDAGW